MAEKYHIFAINSLVKKIVSHKPVNHGFRVFTSQYHVDLSLKRVLTWSRNEPNDEIRRNNLKCYILGVQCFEDLARLLEADYSLIDDLNITDEELRDSLQKSIDFRTKIVVNQVKALMGKSPRYYKRKLRALASQFSDLQDFREDLLATSSSLSRA